MAMKQGSVLVDMEIEGYRPLGAFGQPVHKSYVQLHAAVKQRLGARCADMFARPQWDERNRRVRWIAPIAGEPRGWRDLDPAEQGERALDLQIIRAEFDAYLRDLRAQSGKSGGEAFASVLEQALKTPNDGHLHFIGEQPVMSFWGFSELNGDRFDPLAAAPPPPPRGPQGPTVAAAPAAIAARRSLPAWLWWLIPLLLLLLAFLLWWFLWKDDTAPIERTQPVDPVEETVEPVDDVPPEEPLILPPEETEVVPPEDPVDRYRWRNGDRSYDLRNLRVDENGRVVDENGEVVEGLDPAELDALQDGLVEDGLLPNDVPVEEIDPVLPEDGIVPGDEIIEPEDGIVEDPGIPLPEDPGIPLPEDPVADDVTGEDVTGEDGAIEDGAGDVPAEDPGAPLELPPTPDPTTEDGAAPTDDTTGEAGDATPPTEDGSRSGSGTAAVDFVRGKWRSRSTLTDENGNALDQTYEFDKSGKGESVVRRSDGVRCSAPAEARMEGGELKISELENLKCADGRQIEKSETVCTRGTDGKTSCKGSGFDVQIERPE